MVFLQEISLSSTSEQKKAYFFCETAKRNFFSIGKRFRWIQLRFACKFAKLTQYNLSSNQRRSETEDSVGCKEPAILLFSSQQSRKELEVHEL